MSETVVGATVIGFLTFVLTVVGLMSKIITEIKSLEIRRQFTIFGIVNCDVPEELEPYKDYTNVRKLYKGKGTIRVLHCRTLSYALRHCDWVISDGNDIKIIPPSETRKLHAVISGLDNN